MELLLIRHPVPKVAAGLCYGQTDVPCASEDIEKAGQALLAQLPDTYQLRSSPLQRCERLAQYLSRQRGDLPIETDVRLQEMNFGAWEMQPWDAISRHELAAWTDDFAHYRCGDSGESTQALLERVLECLQQSWLAHQTSGVPQVWVTHAGVMRSLLWLLDHSRAAFIAQALPGAAQSRPLAWPSLRASDWPRHDLPWGCLQRLRLPLL